MKKVVNFAAVIIACCFTSCEKLTNEPDRAAVPINHYSNQILLTVEDGIWIEQTATPFDSILATRNIQCINPLSSSSTKYFKYDFNGQVVDILSELPGGILKSNHYGPKLINNRYFINHIRNSTYGITIFDKNLKPGTELILNFADEFPSSIFTFPPQKIKIFDSQNYILPLLVQDGSTRKQQVALMFVENGVVKRFVKSEGSFSSFRSITDIVIDNSDNVHLLLHSEYYANQKHKFSLFTFNKSTEKIERTLNFERDATPMLSLAANKKGAYLINELYSSEITNPIALEYYDFNTKKISEVNISSDLSDELTTKCYLIPIRSNGNPLFKLIRDTKVNSHQIEVYSIDSDAKLVPVFREKVKRNGLIVQNTSNGLVGLELDEISDGQNLRSYLLIHKSLTDVKPTLLSKGTARDFSGCL